jgi:hypothetical protein
MPLKLCQRASDGAASRGWVAHRSCRHARQKAVDEGLVCGDGCISAVRQRGDEIKNGPCRGFETLGFNSTPISMAEQEAAPLGNHRRVTGSGAHWRERHRSHNRHNAPHRISEKIALGRLATRVRADALMLPPVVATLPGTAVRLGFPPRQTRRCKRMSLRRSCDPPKPFSRAARPCSRYQTPS